MRNESTYGLEQYIEDFKEWSKNVEKILKESNVQDSEIEKWKEKMGGYIQNLEQQAEQSERSGFSEESIDHIEKEVREIQVETERLFHNKSGKEPSNRVPIGEHKLPPLPYDYDALEPYISEKIMRLHHDQHHKSYVDGLNKAEKMMEKARKTNEYDLLKHWEREAAFHGSGHYLHTIFWNNMSPKGGAKPSRNLLAQIEKDFGSFDAFKKHFSEAANKVEGVGWAILVWSPRAHRLEILQSEKHQHFTQWDTIPLLVLDVWEHAYYLQYNNNRGKYVSNWWNIVNWNDVEKRFNEAKQLMWKPY